MRNTLKIDENVFLREATMSLCSSLNPDTALLKLLDYLKDFLPAIGVSFGVFDVGSATLHGIAYVSLDRMINPGPFTIILTKEQTEHYLKHHRNVRYLVMNDPDLLLPHERKVWRQAAWPPNGSVVVIHLELHNQRIGSFAVFAEGKNQYTEAHLNLLLMLHNSLAIAMSNALKYQEVKLSRETLADDNRYLQQQLGKISGDTIIGSDSGLKEVMKQVRQVARINSPVLLLGETGVGKELITNAIHQYSDRNEGPLIKVNCGAIPETLMDSELFGHEKGAFTGAIKQKRGRFERAQNGTIFLDEIGELSLSAQIRLLRVFQNKEIERVGGTSYIPINTRIISATHQNLIEMVEARRFREDLWFRLNIIPITIPPLRHRKADIPALVHYFIERKSMELNIPKPPPLDPAALDKLMAYHWPGNIRELENMVERALIQSRTGNNSMPISFRDLDISPNEKKIHKNKKNPEFFGLDKLVKNHILEAFGHTKGKLYGPNGAAQLLGLNPSTLRGKMRKLGISNDWRK